MTSLGDVVGLLDGWFDPASAESWDAVGLVSGDLADEVTSIHLAVDPTAEVAAEAVSLGADLLLVHHPLFLRGVHGVTAGTPGGRVVRSLIAGGCALFTAHTNADVARGGVNDALAAALGLADVSVLRPSAPLDLHGLVVHVPKTHTAQVFSAVTAAGAGRLGDYEACGFTVGGEGTFRPLSGAVPFVGSVGQQEVVAEDRVELVVRGGLVPAVVAALRAAHPYEEPSFWTWPLAVPSGLGLGRVGALPAPLTLRELAAHVRGALPATTWGVRASGDPDSVVARVAVCGGSGSDLAGLAAARGADVLVTSDTRHHVALDAPVPIIDVAHWASEWPWCEATAARLREALGANVTVSRLVTDAYTVHVC